MFFSNFFAKRKKINQTFHIPKHVAIIMDGNARWAKAKGFPLKLGHKAGAQNLQTIAQDAMDIGIKYLSVYAFSSENWDRPAQEVEYLMELLEDYLSKETKPLIEKGVKIIVSGNLDRLSDKIRHKISEIETKSNNNTNLTLNVAFSYGARQEIVDATRKIALATSQGEISLEAIDEAYVAQHLYHPEIPDPDLLIRTAGDYRISNFLLWQIAYAELYFTNVYWPDFSKKELDQAIVDFNKRERRYGKR